MYTIQKILKKYKLPLLCVGVLAVIGISFLLHAHSPKTFSTVLTSRGFEPRSLLIHKGDTVVFGSNTKREFWPASNSHPSHMLYPDFDPKRQLAPDETWSFTFTEAGVYPFHDHMASGFQGTIMVEGAPGESRENCLNGKNTDQKFNCYSTELASVISSKGIDEGFLMFEKLYKENERFRNNCHDVMHTFGSESYTRFHKTGDTVIRSETSYCDYGFYHGFIEQMFLENGPQQLDEIREYCDALLQNKNFPSTGAARTATWACYHGIGHAIFDTIDGSLWGNGSKMVVYGVGRCTEVITSGDTQLRQCASGVFNSFSNAMSNGNYSLQMNFDDPLKVCNEQTEFFRDTCYRLVTIGYATKAKLSWKDFLTFVTEHPYQTYAKTMIFSYMSDAVRLNRSGVNAHTDPAVCSSLTSSPYQFGCVEGVISGLSERGAPGLEYENVITFCSILPHGTLREHCFEMAALRFSGLYSDEKVQEICTTIATDDRPAVCKK